ncbi:MAG: hypothetical protein HXL38_001700 [Candidatus Saccharimonas sp.]|nr:MAG: hypothetical protein HXL38_001700 [Candidatus Saccharimonas sp.]
MRFSEDVLINIFEEIFKDKVQRAYDENSSIFFIGHRYSMEYNFLEGYISLNEYPKIIGVIYMSEDDVFSENVFDDLIYDVRLFEDKIKKLIEYNKRKAHRKFISR